MKKILFVFAIILILTSIFITVTAAPDVSGAIKSTWEASKSQIRSIVNDVVFPVLSTILAIAFFIKLGSAYFDYKKHGQFEWTAPVILFACLIFSLTASTFLWTIIDL